MHWMFPTLINTIQTAWAFKRLLIFLIRQNGGIHINLPVCMDRPWYCTVYMLGRNLPSYFHSSRFVCSWCIYKRRNTYAYPDKVYAQLHDLAKNIFEKINIIFGISYCRAFFSLMIHLETLGTVNSRINWKRAWWWNIFFDRYGLGKDLVQNHTGKIIWIIYWRRSWKISTPITY